MIKKQKDVVNGRSVVGRGKDDHNLLHHFNVVNYSIFTTLKMF